ncbi:sensor histidine kinase [Lacticaseibacillus sp. GG6-2]
MRPKRSEESSATQISRAYAWLLTVVMLVTGLATISVVGGYLVNNKRQDADQLMTTLHKSFANNKPDWDYWRSTANINMHTTFVRVTVQPHDKPKRQYYTRHTKDFLQDNWKTWPLLEHIQYQDDQGIYYHRVQRKKVGESEVTYELWLSLNNVIGLFELILTVIVGISLGGLVLGISLIHVLARRLNQPLVDLTDAATSIIEAKDVTYHETLPVPAGPQEVHKLGTEFNRLLQSLNRQVIRDHQFVSDASHELRTPLAAIRGHVGLIRRHATTHPEIVPDSLATIESSALSMQKLIERLLALSRMDHAHLAGNWFDVSKLLKAVAATYPKPDDVTITVVAPAELLAYANRDSVEQVVVSLLNNAVKYAGAGTITLRATRLGTQVLLAVEDLGSGVPDADKPKIFDRFYRVDDSREKKIGGTGLGLAIAQRLVDLNHGELTVSDNHPHGAVFTIALAGNNR